MPAAYQGKCHCGRVRYEIAGPVRQVVECHCESCRRITGSVWHPIGARLADVTITAPESFLGPWTRQFTWELDPDGMIYEAVCDPADSRF